MTATTVPRTPAVAAAPEQAQGMLLGLVGVALFSLTLPFTKIPFSSRSAVPWARPRLQAPGSGGSARRCRHAAR
jgi:hypothetical protein